jgi:hypothetical protein
MRRDARGLSTYIAETCRGVGEPIFFDPHYPIQLNQPPVTLVTGQPGSGKTFLGLLLGAHSAILGKITVILDPKGDFLILKNLQKAGLIDKMTAWSIINHTGEIDSKNIGMLDPLSLTKDINQNISLTIDVIDSLMKGGLNKEQNNAIIPILQDEAEKPFPSMKSVIMKLQRQENEQVRYVGINLEQIMNSPKAQLLMGNPKISSLKPNFSEGTTVLSLVGLKFPAADKLADDYTNEERLSLVIMSLLANIVYSVLMEVPKTYFKTLMVDEAWAVFSSNSGRSLLASVGLLGRSQNMATILLTQSPTHLAPRDGEANLETSISTRFCFRSRSRDDNKLNCANLRIPENEGYEELFEQLETGQCVFRDCQEQLAIIHIVANDEWAKIFNTRPDPKKDQPENFDE